MVQFHPRIAARGLLALTLLGATLGAVGCATDDAGITPPKDGFYFPVSVAVDPVRDVLYVANSNADLRYNGGTLMALDLSALPTDLSQVVDAVQSGALDCSVDRIDASRWECSEKSLVIDSAVVRIGDFPSDLTIRSDGGRLYLPVRGQEHLLWVDVAELPDGRVDLRCSSESPECAPGSTSDCPEFDCDADHEVATLAGSSQRLPNEPFGVLAHEPVAVHVDAEGRRQTCRDGVSAVPCACGAAPACSDERKVDCCSEASGLDHVYVAHLAGGEVSFFTSDAAGVRLVDFRGGFFETASSIRGGFALAASLPGDPTTPIYVSSRTASAVASFVIQQDRRIVAAPRAQIIAASPGTDVRGIAFSPGGEVLYAVSRSPSSLAALDMTPENGVPRAEPLWLVEVCPDPAALRLLQNPAKPQDPRAQLAYVVCFAEPVIYVVDTQLAQVVDRIYTGSGANGLVIDPRNRRAFTPNFVENTVGVIDLDPSHSSYHRMVLRIGMQRNLVKD